VGANNIAKTGHVSFSTLRRLSAAQLSSGPLARTIKLMTRILSVFLLLAILGVPQTPQLRAQPKNVDSTLASLISRWDKRDGAVFLDLGPMLADQCVLRDTAFFAAMQEHPSSFKEWLDELQSSTFTIFWFRDSSDLEVRRRRLIELKEGLLSTARRFSRSSDFGAMADTLNTVVRKLEIRTIE
jgi:hypothetical protein